MLNYMKQRSYKEAKDIADMIDWRKVKNTSLLCAVSEIYEYSGEYQKSRDILFLAYDRSPDSRKIIYRLGILALKLGQIREAADCYKEFVAIAPKDPNQYILKYKILREKKAPLEEQIEVLEQFKSIEYVEKWAFELAKLYHEAGRTTESIEECDDLILWFSDGKYVLRAMELKRMYKPLTPLQQEKYNAMTAETVKEVVEEVVEEATEEETPVEETPAAEEAVEELPVIELLPEEPAPAPTIRIPVEEVAALAKPIIDIPEIKIDFPIIAEPVAEEVVVEEVDEAVVEEVAEEITEEVPAQEPAPAKPTLSIEEMLQEWEAKQKENAEMIREKVEQVEQEKAAEKEAAEAAEPVEPVVETEILADDIRQLMEELESESADIEAKKVVETSVVEELPVVELPKEEVVAEETKQPLLQKVMDKFSTMELPKLDLPTIEELFEDEPSISEEVTKIVEEQANTTFVVEEAPGIRMGDTQSMAAVAKALKNNVEMQFPDDEDDDILPEPEEAVQARPVNKNIYDTGFIVKGRYDLEAQSEIGLKAGLTEEQKKLFSYFVPVHGMSEQLVEVLHADKKCKARYGTSRIGNLLIIGRKGSGKTVLAVDIVKAIQKNRRMKNGKMGIVTADSLNKKNIAEIAEKLHGGAIIIEKASVLNRRTIEDLCDVMEGQTGEMLVVLEDERRPLEAMLEAYPQFAKKFTSRVELPVFINDELVTFGQTYAKENGYKIDEMGILALYSRIDMLQREEKVVTVADVKDILDEAIESAHKASFKKVMHKLLGKSKDDSDRIILKEEDFR